MGFVPSAMDWSKSEWGSCALGDKRRTFRAVRMGASFVSRSSASMPKQMDDMAELKAAYRFLDCATVTHESLSVDHWSRTRDAARAPGVFLFVQDTTDLNYSGHHNTPDLGFISKGLACGIEVHTTLGVVPGPKPQVLGVAYQKPWTRAKTRPTTKESDSSRRRRRTEHDVWEESVAAIGPAPGSGTTWVSVGDRGSDVFAYMSQADALGWHTLVRSKFNRVLVEDETEPETYLRLLHDRMRVLAPMGQTSLSLRARPGCGARTVSLNVAWTSVTLPRPRRKKGNGTLAMNCVRVWEDPQPGQKPEPLEWILLTSLPVDNLEHAMTIIGYYRHRWLVEEFHKCLKTGCRIEARQVGTKDKLLALLAFFSIVSIFLMQFKAPRAGMPTPKEIVKVVRALTGTPEDLDDPGVLWRRIAMLGGFLGRKGDGQPGWQTIWAGWNRLQDILFGMELAQGMRCG